MRYVVTLFLVGIIYSLGSALFHLLRSTKGSDPSGFQKFTLHLALAIALFLILMVSYKLGWVGAKV